MKLDISKYKPCEGAVKYLAGQPDFKTAWENCQRGDWMLWMAANLKVDLQTLTLAKGKCAETVVHLMKDERSIAAVKAAIDFGNGSITKEELKKATADAAYAADDANTAAADDAVYADAAADAAYASAAYASAVYDADDANAAADAANAAADAADAAADATYAAVYDNDAAAAKKENQIKTANICREVLSKAVLPKLEKLYLSQN